MERNHDWWGELRGEALASSCAKVLVVAFVTQPNHHCYTNYPLHVLQAREKLHGTVCADAWICMAATGSSLLKYSFSWEIWTSLLAFALWAWWEVMIFYIYTISAGEKHWSNF